MNTSKEVVSLKLLNISGNSNLTRIMPVKVPNKSLEMLLDSLFQGDTLKSWQITEDKFGSVLVKLKFQGNQQSHASVNTSTPVYYKRKSQSQIIRDRERISVYRRHKEIQHCSSSSQTDGYLSQESGFYQYEERPVDSNSSSEEQIRTNQSNIYNETDSQVGHDQPNITFSMCDDTQIEETFGASGYNVDESSVRAVSNQNHSENIQGKNSESDSVKGCKNAKCFYVDPFLLPDDRVIDDKDLYLCEARYCTIFNVREFTMCSSCWSKGCHQQHRKYIRKYIMT